MFKKVILPLVVLAVVAALTIGAMCTIPAMNMATPPICFGVAG